MGGELYGRKEGGIPWPHRLTPCVPLRWKNVMLSQESASYHQVYPSGLTLIAGIRGVHLILIWTGLNQYLQYEVVMWKPWESNTPQLFFWSHGSYHCITYCSHCTIIIIIIILRWERHLISFKNAIREDFCRYDSSDVWTGGIVSK